MKKIIIMLVLSLLINEKIEAQATKEEVYQKIKDSYSWLNAQMLEQFTELNFTEEQWQWIIKNDFYGLSSVNTAGDDLSDYYVMVADSKLQSECRYGSDGSCLERVKSLKPKVSIVFNGTKAPLEDKQMKLTLQALSSVAGFIGDNNIYGTKAGWRPKTDHTKFIVNIDSGTGQPKVAWNASGSELNITVFVGSEAPDWVANLNKKLHANK